MVHKLTMTMTRTRVINFETHSYTFTNDPFLNFIEEESSTSKHKTINYGYKVLVKCGVQVTQGLSRNAKYAASLLHSKGFISDELLDQIVNLPATDFSIGQKLYTAVLHLVKNFPQRYPEFISVLEENISLHSDLLTSLEEAYCEIGEKFSLYPYPSKI